MSRSYRKFAVVKDRCRNSKNFMKPKADANRMVRRTADVPQHSGYKKLYCSWNISDYRFVGEQSERELKIRWKRRNKYLINIADSYREAYRNWIKYYKGK